MICQNNTVNTNKTNLTLVFTSQNLLHISHKVMLFSQQNTFRIEAKHITEVVDNVMEYYTM